MLNGDKMNFSYLTTKCYNDTADKGEHITICLIRVWSRDSWNDKSLVGGCLQTIVGSQIIMQRDDRSVE